MRSSSCGSALGEDIEDIMHTLGHHLVEEFMVSIPEASQQHYPCSAISLAPHLRVVFRYIFGTVLLSDQSRHRRRDGGEEEEREGVAEEARARGLHC